MASPSTNIPEVSTDSLRIASPLIYLRPGCPEDDLCEFRDNRHLFVEKSVDVYRLITGSSDRYALDKMQNPQAQRKLSLANYFLWSGVVGFINHEHGHLNFGRNQYPTNFQSSRDYEYYISSSAGGLEVTNLVTQNLFYESQPLSDSSSKVLYVSHKFDPLLQEFSGLFPNISLTSLVLGTSEGSTLSDPQSIRKCLKYYLNYLENPDDPFSRDKDILDHSYGYGPITIIAGLLYHYLDPVFMASVHGLKTNQEHADLIPRLPQFSFFESIYGPLFRLNYQTNMSRIFPQKEFSDDVLIQGGLGLLANDGIHRNRGGLIHAGITHENLMNFPSSAQALTAGVATTFFYTPEDVLLTASELKLGVPLGEKFNLNLRGVYKTGMGSLPGYPFHPGIGLGVGVEYFPQY